LSACGICTSPHRRLVDLWVRKRVPYRTIAARLRELGGSTWPSSIPAHKRHARLVVLPDYQLRKDGPGRE
jgi:hypothetical protein